MKTDLEKFQEIVKDINTIIFGKPVKHSAQELIDTALGYRERAQYQEKKLSDLQNRMKSWDKIVNTHKDTPKKKRGRGRPKGSKNKKSKWL